MASAVPGYQDSTVSASSYKLSLEDAALQKTVEEWFQVIRDKSRVDPETVGLAVTINGCLEKIDWYGHAEMFRWLWPGLLRAAVLEALLEKPSTSEGARPFDQARFQDLLRRLETEKPQQERPSAQTVGDAWQFARYRAKRTCYFRTGSAAHTTVSL